MKSASTTPIQLLKILVLDSDRIAIEGRMLTIQLDTKKTTVEQRMLANGAFSALNDA